MFVGQKDADIPGTRIQGTDESDQEQGQECRQGGKGESGPQHQQRGTQQQVPVMEAMAPGPHRQGGECRTQQGRRTQDADIQGAETERQQIGRQENCHIAIGKCPQSLAHQER
jgi:hypothetical protein